VQIWNAAAYGGSNLSANIDTAKNLPGRAFEMPDGWSNVFGIERYRAAEGLFDETAAVTVSRSWRHICAKALTSYRMAHKQQLQRQKRYQAWCKLP